MKTRFFSNMRNWAMALLILAMPLVKVDAKSVKLKAGTQIPLELEETVSSNRVSNGTIINFKCTRDIKIGDDVVISAGTLAKGQVSRVKKNGILGKNGEIEVKVTSITAVDGSEVYLSASSLYDDGKDKLLLALFLCFIIKGDEGEIPAGTQCLASVSGEVAITVD